MLACAIMANLFNDFPLKTRRHFEQSGGHNLGPDMLPVQEEKLTEMHLARTQHTSQREDSGPQSTAGASSPWVTSYQAQTSGDDSFQRKRPQGKRCVHNPSPAGSLSLFSGFGSRPQSEEERLAQLQLGTTKATRHLPGYTGHISHTSATRDQPVAPRDLDKSRHLITQNYNPIPGYTGRLK